MESPVWVRALRKNKDNLPKLLNMQCVSICVNWRKKGEREPKRTRIIAVHFWAASSQHYCKIKSSEFNKGSLFTCDFWSARSRWRSHVSDPHSRLCCITWCEVRNSDLEIRNKVMKLPVSSFWETEARFSFISTLSFLSCRDLQLSLMLQWHYTP